MRCLSYSLCDFFLLIDLIESNLWTFSVLSVIVPYISKVKDLISNVSPGSRVANYHLFINPLSYLCRIWENSDSNLLMYKRIRGIAAARQRRSCILPELKNWFTYFADKNPEYTIVCAVAVVILQEWIFKRCCIPTRLPVLCSKMNSSFSSFIRFSSTLPLSII